VTVVEIAGPSPEVLGRPLVVLEPVFVQMRYDQNSFAKIASRKRQIAFGVTLGLREATFRISYVRRALEAGDAAAVVLKEREAIKGMWYVTTYTDVLPPRIALYLEPDVPDEFGEKAGRLEELTKTVHEMNEGGAEGPPGYEEGARRAERDHLVQGQDLQEVHQQAGLPEDNGKDNGTDSGRDGGHLVEGREGQPIPRQHD
jgi:hypothetical protein